MPAADVPASCMEPDERIEEADVINDIKAEAEKKMKKSLEALHSAFNKIRTGRAHPAILDSVMVNYYGQETPLKQCFLRERGRQPDADSRALGKESGTHD